MLKTIKWVVIAGIVAFLGYAAYMINFGMKVNIVRFDLKAPFDLVADELPELEGDIKVLVFNKTNSYRHYDAIDAAFEMFEELGEKNGWAVYSSTNGAVHNTEDLDKFDVIVWHNVSGDVLTETQRAAFKDWVESGGSWLGIHGSGGSTHYAWDWFGQELLRAQFIGHNMNPQFLEADIIKDKDHPVTEGIPDIWTREEEYYSFTDSPRDRVEVLLSLDESSIDFELIHQMGDDHPLAWVNKVGKGTSLYSSLGHKGTYYDEPAHIQMLEQSVIWLATQNKR